MYPVKYIHREKRHLANLKGMSKIIPRLVKELQTASKLHIC